MSSRRSMCRGDGMSARDTGYSAMPTEAPHLREGINRPPRREAIEANQSHLPRQSDQSSTNNAFSDFAQQNSSMWLGAKNVSVNESGIIEQQKSGSLAGTQRGSVRQQALHSRHLQQPKCSYPTVDASSDRSRQLPIPPSSEAWDASRPPTSTILRRRSSLEQERGWDSDSVTPGQLGCQIQQRAPKGGQRAINHSETEAATTGKHVTEQSITTQGVSIPLGCPTGDENRVRRAGLRRSWGPAVVAADPVIFSCFAPSAVSGGMAFLLRISAYLRQQRNDVLDEAQSAGVTETGVLGEMRIVRNKRDLPIKIFQVLPENHMVIGDTSIQAPSVRDFVWTGDVANADFKVGCKQDAEPGVVHCNAMVIEGDTTTRLSFRIQVVQAGSLTGIDREELETSMEEVPGEVAAISPDELEIERLLGRGVQGETFAGIWRGKPVAIKRLADYIENFNHERSFSTLEHEAAILSRLGHHPHIVEFYGLCRRGEGSSYGTVEVVTKLEKGGSVEQALGLVENGRHHETVGHHGGRFNTFLEFGGGVRTAWARDIACGLANSHAAGVVHNDVACRNALLSERGVGGRALLCDFGISDVLRDAKLGAATLMDLGSTSLWPLRQLPKEAWEEPHALSAASDSWMFGTMLYELFAGRKPFADLDTREVRRLVLEGKKLETPELLKNQGPKVVEVYEGCLSSDWFRRPSMEDVVAKLTPTTLKR